MLRFDRGFSRHCEKRSDEAIQGPAYAGPWIASPPARNDVPIEGDVLYEDFVAAHTGFRFSMKLRMPSAASVQPHISATRSMV